MVHTVNPYLVEVILMSIPPPAPPQVQQVLYYYTHLHHVHVQYSTGLVQHVGTVLYNWQAHFAFPPPVTDYFGWFIFWQFMVIKWNSLMDPHPNIHAHFCPDK